LNGESLEAKEEGTAPGGARIYKIEDVKIKCKHNPLMGCDYAYFSEKDAIGCLVCMLKETNMLLRKFLEVIENFQVIENE
jgi:hypothetical protein